MLGVRVPQQLLNLQSAIAGVKIHCLEDYFLSLESYWSVNVYNGLTLPIWTFETQVMAKRKARSQIGTLTPEESTQFPCVQVACNISLEISWQGLQLAIDRIAIEASHRRLCESKIAGVLVVGLPLGSPRRKNHLDVAPMERCRVYYKGEDGGFPQVGAVVSLVCSSCP
jgi:hypothetical protein